MSSGSERYGEYIQRQTTREQHRMRQQQLKAAVKTANKHVAAGRYRDAARTLRDVILPSIKEMDGTKPMAVYHQEIGAMDTLPWHWAALKRFKDDPERFCRDLSIAPIPTAERNSAAKTIREALASAESITAYHGVTDSALHNRVDAVGFHAKVGEHQQKPDMSFGEPPISATTDELGPLKHCFTGGTGGGKSTGGSRQFEDYYQASVFDGRNYKCLDPVGMGEGENITYGIPQQQSALKRERREQGLPETFEGIDGYEPENEILVPLTPDIEDFELPYDTEADEFAVTPFTIPASDLSESLLVKVVNSRVSANKARTIRSAYQTVSAERVDWSLSDLADEIRYREELSEKHKKDAIRAIKNLQDLGFIRTQSDDRTLNWDRIFSSTNVVTSFSQAPCANQRDQLVIVAYILDQFWHRRRRSHSFPHCALWLRELADIAPNIQERRQRGEQAKALLEHIVHLIKKIMRKNRHIGTSVITDIQRPGEADNNIRQRHNRFVLFGGTSDDTGEDIFSWTNNNGWHSASRALTDENGRAAIVGGVDIAARDSDRWGIGPVYLTPPSWHHHDTDKDTTGWAVLADHIGGELRTPDWDTSIPEALQIGLRLPSDEDDGEGGDEADEMEPQEYARFEAITLKRNNPEMSLRDIAKRIPNNPDTGKPFYASTISDWVEDIVDTSGDETTDTDGENVA